MKIWLFIAALNGFIAVTAGAFGAHGLQGRLDSYALGVFETAARYQIYHALAMGIAAIALKDTMAHAAGGFFLAGIILFSGSLYALALTGMKGLGMVTPFGGLAFLVGWALIATAAWKAVR